MTDKRNLFHLQMAATLKRQDQLEQYCHAWYMLADGSTDSDTLISLERTFFLNRKQATERLKTARTDLIKLDNW